MSSRSNPTRRVVSKRGPSAASREQCPGLAPDAVPFAKPSVNQYPISDAAVTKDVSPVLPRDGLMQKKAPIGRKLRYFATRNHFLNYWDSKMDMVCSPKTPYGSINLLKVFRIAQNGRKIVLSFPEDFGLKAVNLKAPTAAVAKKWAKNMSSRRRYFEMMYNDYLEKEIEHRANAHRAGVPGRDRVRSMRSERPRSNTSRRSSLSSIPTPGHPGTPSLGGDAEHNAAHDSDSEGDSDFDENGAYVSMANARDSIMVQPFVSGSTDRDDSDATSRASNAFGQRPAVPPKKLKSGTTLASALATLPLRPQSQRRRTESSVTPGPPPSPGLSEIVRQASINSARRRSRSTASALSDGSWRSPVASASPSPHYAPPPKDSDEFLPPTMPTSSAKDDFGIPSSDDESEPATATDWDQVVDTETGKTFWYNKRTRRSQWERPLSLTLEVANKKRNDERLQRSERRLERERLREKHALVREVLESDEDSSESEEGPEWEEHIDPGSGMPFWFNRRTKESTWEVPTSAGAGGDGGGSSAGTAKTLDKGFGNSPTRSRRASPRSAARLKLQASLADDEVDTPRRGWREQVDPSTGETFYFHKRTRQSTWTEPEFWDELEVGMPQ